MRALKEGYLEAIEVKEGQWVKEGDLLFKVIPILYQKEAEAASAEAKVARLELKFAEQLYKQMAISVNEVKLIEAKLLRAEAKAQLAQAALNFAIVKAPFEGIIDRLHHQQGTLVEEGEELTTLSDNGVMWVYFNVPEKRYLEYMANLKQNKDMKIEILLAGGKKFDQLGMLDPAHGKGAIEADFNNETGNIPFRADFPNPDRLLRNGQTGTVLLSWVENDALVIPQRATFEVLTKRYVFVIDEENVAHQTEITIENELEDIFVIKKGGVDVDHKIVLEGIRQIRDGEKVEYEDRKPEEVLQTHAGSLRELRVRRRERPKTRSLLWSGEGERALMSATGIETVYSRAAGSTDSLMNSPGIFLRGSRCTRRRCCFVSSAAGCGASVTRPRPRARPSTRQTLYRTEEGVYIVTRDPTDA